MRNLHGNRVLEKVKEHRSSGTTLKGGFVVDALVLYASLGVEIVVAYLPQKLAGFDVEHECAHVVFGYSIEVVRCPGRAHCDSQGMKTIEGTNRDLAMLEIDTKELLQQIAVLVSAVRRRPMVCEYSCYKIIKDLLTLSGLL